MPHPQNRLNATSALWRTGRPLRSSLLLAGLGLALLAQAQRPPEGPEREPPAAEQQRRAPAARPADAPPRTAAPAGPQLPQAPAPARAAAPAIGPAMPPAIQAQREPAVRDQQAREQQAREQQAREAREPKPQSGPQQHDQMVRPPRTALPQAQPGPQREPERRAEPGRGERPPPSVQPGPSYRPVPVQPGYRPAPEVPATAWVGRPPRDDREAREWREARERGERRIEVRRGPPLGVVVPVLPPVHRVVMWGGVQYRCSDGVWYAPHRQGYVVVRPPYGVVIDDLPFWRTALVVGGVSYVVVNSVYYRERQDGYEVVPPPPDAPTLAAVELPASDDPLLRQYVYPARGQGAEQQAADEYDCHRWAVGQTGFDPTDAALGTAAAPMSKRDDYLRARSACLEGRGYTVR